VDCAFKQNNVHPAYIRYLIFFNSHITF
jgi:hypothetical protein